MDFGLLKILLFWLPIIAYMGWTVMSLNRDLNQSDKDDDQTN